MRKIALLGLCVAAVALVVPGIGAAHSPSTNFTCSSLSNPDNDESDLTVAAPEGLGTLYLDLETTGVYAETNGYAGLQTHAHTCRIGNPNTGTITTVPADTGVAVPSA